MQSKAERAEEAQLKSYKDHRNRIYREWRQLDVIGLASLSGKLRMNRDRAHKLIIPQLDWFRYWLLFIVSKGPLRSCIGRK